MLGPEVIVLRVSSIMAVAAGRSVVFVTGNAKKLEEVEAKQFIPEVNSTCEVVL